jgi:DNA polymerase III delta subunit
MSALFSEGGDLLLRFILLAGDDATSREIARGDMVKAVTDRQPAAEVERYNADDTGFAAFFERIISPSLLAPLRVFLVPDVHLLDETEFELLGGLLDYDLPDACVVLETERMRSSKKTREAALSKKYAAWLDAFEERAQRSPSAFLVQLFPKPPDYKMADWVEENTQRLFDRRISKTDAERLVDLVGTDTAVLHSELSKIDLYLAAGETVTAGVIDKVAGATRLSTPFELAQALGEKNMAHVLEIIESIYAGSVYLPLYVGAVFRHFWALFKMNMFAKANPAVLGDYRSSGRQRHNDAAMAFGVASGILTHKQANRLYPAVVKPRLVDQALSFSFGHYKRVFSLLSEFDSGIKTGRFDDSKAGFQVFCYRIVKGA